MTKKKVFIVGWYGTETVGDKAILGGIVSELQNTNQHFHIIVSSLYPFVTKRTLEELQIKAEVVSPFSLKFLYNAITSTEVIMGGGPLMDLEVLSIPLWAFLISKIFLKKRIIWGCGLGPLTKPKYIGAVTLLLNFATEVKLRDSQSVSWAKKLTGREDIKLTGDPARDYVNFRRRSLSQEKRVSSEKKAILACYLRDWPRDYANHLSTNEYLTIKENFERNLAYQIIKISKTLNISPVFYSMQSFVVGNDDRVFNRYFISTWLNDIETKYEISPSSVDSVIKSMLEAKFCISMRFHSVLFANELRANFFAIDYTNGGKIYGYLQDQNVLHRCIKLSDIALGQTGKIEILLKDVLL